MKVYIFRHGITKTNEEKKFTGFTDISISDKGRKELEVIRNTIELPNFDYVVSSPMIRCIDSFKVLFPNRIIDEFCTDLKEANFGTWEGEHYTSLKDDVRYNNWVFSEELDAEHKGESYLEFKKRVINAFEEIISRHSDKESLLIMCHGGVIRTIMDEIIDPTVGYFNWEIPNGLGYALELEENSITYKIYK